MKKTSFYKTHEECYNSRWTKLVLLMGTIVLSILILYGIIYSSINSNNSLITVCFIISLFGIGIAYVGLITASDFNTAKEEFGKETKSVKIIHKQELERLTIIYTDCKKEYKIDVISGLDILAGNRYNFKIDSYNYVGKYKLIEEVSESPTPIL